MRSDCASWVPNKKEEVGCRNCGVCVCVREMAERDMPHDREAAAALCRQASHPPPVDTGRGRCGEKVALYPVEDVERAGLSIVGGRGFAVD